MTYLARSRHLIPALILVGVLSALTAGWGQLLLALPLPSIPILARALPLEALLLTCIATVFAATAYPGHQPWEQVAPRNIQLFSHLLALALGTLAALVFTALSPAPALTLLKGAGLLGTVACISPLTGGRTSLLPPLFLLANTVFARTPAGGFAPWAWLLNESPDPLHILLTPILALGLTGCARLLTR